MFSRVLLDLRYALRTLRRNPSFAVVSIMALALGIGANSAVFTVVNSVLLRPLAFPDPDQLVVVHERNLKAGFPQFSLSPGNYLDYRDHAHDFTSFAALSQEGVTLSFGVAPESVDGTRVTSNFFQTLGVNPSFGRVFTASESKPGSNRVAILSHALWVRRFAASRAVLGKTLKLNREIYTIVGVMPRGFTFPDITRIWTPLALNDNEWRERGGHFLAGIARLKPGAGVRTATADLNSIAARAEHEYPDSNTGWDTTAKILQEEIVGDIRPAMLTLTGAVGFVLLIACVNLANLLLSRSAARRSEIAIRGALGAGRSRLLQQLITESCLLAFVGAIVGLGIAWCGVQYLIGIGGDVLPVVAEIRLDGRVVAFTAAVAIVTAMLFGLAPAHHLARTDLASVAREGTHGASVSFRRDRLRSLLVIGEIALALVLLNGAALLMRSFYHLQSIDPGFNPHGVLTFAVDLPDVGYHTDERRIEFINRTLDKLRALPGVESVGATSILPFSGSNVILTFEQIGKPRAARGKEPSADFRRVTPGYFKALNIALKRGRDFSDHDNALSVRVAVISESMARRFYPGENPIGHEIKMGDGSKAAEIVGIVSDIRDQDLAASARPAIYESALQSSEAQMFYALHTSHGVESSINPARVAMLAIDPELPLSQLGTVDSLLVRSLATQRSAMFLMTTFAALALGLSMVGVYGVISYSVTQATHEIGIRLALGAGSLDVLRLVFGYAGILVAAGFTIGIPAAFGAGQLLASQLFEVKSSDPLTYLWVAGILLGTCIVACAVPAARAAMLDPLTALRTE